MTDQYKKGNYLWCLTTLGKMVHSTGAMGNEDVATFGDN